MGWKEQKARIGTDIIHANTFSTAPEWVCGVRGQQVSATAMGSAIPVDSERVRGERIIFVHVVNFASSTGKHNVLRLLLIKSH